MYISLIFTTINMCLPSSLERKSRYTNVFSVCWYTSNQINYIISFHLSIITQIKKGSKVILASLPYICYTVVRLGSVSNIRN